MLVITDKYTSFRTEYEDMSMLNLHITSHVLSYNGPLVTDMKI